jgi:ribonuclease Z
VYSGDTRPCSDLVQAGQGATVLIHEATFDESKQLDAIDKKHSTTAEALAVSESNLLFKLLPLHYCSNTSVAAVVIAFEWCATMQRS